MTPGQSPEVMSKGIFEDLIERRGAKAILRSALRRGDVDLLLTGPPASGKSVALTAVEEAVETAEYYDASGVTKSKLRDILAADHDLLLLDEIDDMRPDAYKALTTAMEQSRVTKAVQGDTFDVEIDTQILAASNDTRSIPAHIKSRFTPVEFPPYDRDEFLSVCEVLMVRVVEWVDASETARAACEEVASELDEHDPRTARDVLRLAGGLERVEKIARAIQDADADVGSEPLTADEIGSRRAKEQSQKRSEPQHMVDPDTFCDMKDQFQEAKEMAPVAASEPPESEEGETEPEPELPDNIGIPPSYLFDGWGVEVDVEGIGEGFGANLPCERGERDFVYTFFMPDDVERAEAVGQLEDTMTEGSIGRTKWLPLAHTYIFNKMGTPDDWEDHDSVWAWLIALPVCMDDGAPVGGRWTADDNVFYRNGGVNLREVIAYRIDRVENVPSELKDIRDIINPGEFLDG